MTQVDKRLVRKAFSRAANHYDEVAVLQREIADRIIGRLKLFSFSPRRILDLGAGTGYATGKLMKTYPKAKVFALDFAHPMLLKARKQGSWLKRPACICADMDQLPLPDHHFDLIFSNATLQWSNDLSHTLSELRRVLKPEGLLIFSTFGPDTLMELRNAWAEVDQHSHTNQFLDMHDVGDAMVQNGFAMPVLDVDRITLTYQSVKDLMQDLKHLGAHNVTSQRNRSLTGKQRIKDLTQAYEQFRRNGELPASYEVVHAHAWATAKQDAGVKKVTLEKMHRP